MTEMSPHMALFLLRITAYYNANLAPSDVVRYQQHSEEDVRLAFVTSRYVPQDVLVKMALIDPSEQVRLAAIERLDVIDLLGEC